MTCSVFESNSKFINQVLVVDAIHQVFSEQTYRAKAPHIETQEDGEMVFSWSEDHFYLEIETFGGEFDNNCALFRWFFIKHNFVEGLAGIGTSNDIPDELKKIMLEYLALV